MDIRIAPDASVQAVSAAADVHAPTVPPIPPPPAIANISPFGDLMGKLRELSDASPAAFRHVSAQLRDVLQGAAAQAPGHEGAALGELAHGFDEASRTGDLQSIHAATAAPQVPVAPVMAELATHVDVALKAASSPAS